jgi:hypothetical protein
LTKRVTDNPSFLIEQGWLKNAVNRVKANMRVYYPYRRKEIWYIGTSVGRALFHRASKRWWILAEA